MWWVCNISNINFYYPSIQISCEIILIQLSWSFSLNLITKWDWPIFHSCWSPSDFGVFLMMFNVMRILLYSYKFNCPFNDGSNGSVPFYHSFFINLLLSHNNCVFIVASTIYWMYLIVVIVAYEFGVPLKSQQNTTNTASFQAYNFPILFHKV